MRLFNVETKGQTRLLMKRKDRYLITREPLPKGHPLREYIKGTAITTQDLKRPEFNKAVAHYLAYVNGHGPFMPAVATRHSLIEGARKGKVKSGRSSIWKNLQGTLLVSPAEIPVTREGAELESYDDLLDSLVRGTNGVVLQFQARVRIPWEMKFQLLMLDDNITEANLMDTINGAGLYAGIGAWVSGGNGRFRLSSFEQAPTPDEDGIAALLQPAD